MNNTEIWPKRYNYFQIWSLDTKQVDPQISAIVISREQRHQEKVLTSELNFFNSILRFDAAKTLKEIFFEGF